MLYPRYAKSHLQEAMQDTPVVILHGPRQSGKTTLALDVGDKKYQYITFDDDTELIAAKNDPRGYIEELPNYCILDEVQRVPEIFPSIKLVVDKNRLPGRFLLTGSANILATPRLTESLAGRVEIINLRPLTQTEIESSQNQFLHHAFQKTLQANFSHRLGDALFDRVISGGFPEPLQRESVRRRHAWYSNYISVMTQRDIAAVSNIQYGDDIPKLLQRIANNTASLVNISKLNKGFNFDVKTTRRYIYLLKQLFLIDELPPWFSNCNKRLIKSPKLHLSDSGLLCSLSGFNKAQLTKDRSTMGQITETFVFNELLRQATWYDETLQFFHYRDKDQYEVDIIIQNNDGDLIGIEVKLAASVNEADFRGLKRFKRQQTSKFIAGYVLYDGERSLSFNRGFMAVPIQALWADN